MTTFSDDMMDAIRAYADREGITTDKAADLLLGYGLNAVAKHDRYLESLKPRPYHVESCETRVDGDGETALTEYSEIVSLPTLDEARTALCGIATPDADTKAVIMSAPLGHVFAIGGEYYRITKTA
jgi:hypothetical protein